MQTTVTRAHALVKPAPGEAAAKKATCSCGLVLQGVSRADARASIIRHANRRNREQ